MNFSNVSILVVGDLILDEYVVGEHYRISDEAPVPILKADKFEVRLGGAANVAHNLKTLGCKVLLCGVIGQKHQLGCEPLSDRFGYGYSAIRFMRLIKEASISSHLIVEGDCLTTTKTRVLINRQQVVRYDSEQNALNKEICKDVETRLDSIDYRKVDLIIVSDYRKGVITEEIMDLLKSKGKRIIVDPKPQNIDLYNSIFCLTPNMSEFINMTELKHEYTDAQLVQCAQDFIKQHELESLIVTLGVKGAFFCDRKRSQFIQGGKEEVVNMVGAGDTFVAAFGGAVASGIDEINAVNIANCAASIIISKQYTSAISMDELIQKIKGFKWNENIYHL